MPNPLQVLLDLIHLTRAPEDALDELVHQTAQQMALTTLNAIEDEAGQEKHIAGCEAIAGEVNNQGAEGQVRWLLAGRVEVKTIARAILDEV